MVEKARYLDLRPNSYIGRAVPRPNLKRLLEGRGQFVSDVVLPRMVHVCFVRSPHAHAWIRAIDTAAAKRAPGVVAVVTGAELANVCTPWVGVLTHLKGLKSAPQHAIAVAKACWQGEAVATVVAKTRALAEDAAELVGVEYEPLAPVADPEAALDPGTPVIHAELGDNLAFERTLDAGEVDQAFRDADAVVEALFVFGRHTGVTLEPRAIVADWNPGEARLTVYQGTQAPHMMQNIFAKHLGLDEHQVRVLCKDVGGSFGIKVHVYADEMATAALSKLLKRPVKFVADRIESFVSDIHARDHRVKARIGVKNDGRITAFELAARKIGMDVLELRRRNLVADDAYPCASASGLKFEKLSHHASLDKLIALMDYESLRREQESLRRRGMFRGIGFAAFIEVTNPSAAFYGVGGARISSQDGALVRLDATGAIICHSGVTEQGQGTEAVIAQVVATAMGVSIEHVRVVTGDTDHTPYGGGTWASRGAGIGGEAAWQAGKALRQNVLAVAASILQAEARKLDIRGGIVVDADSGRERIELKELARIAYFRPDTLPPGFQAELMAVRHYVPRAYPFAFTNGV